MLECVPRRHLRTCSFHGYEGMLGPPYGLSSCSGKNTRTLSGSRRERNSERAFTLPLSWVLMYQPVFQ